jgi:hypothetical protein
MLTLTVDRAQYVSRAKTTTKTKHMPEAIIANLQLISRYHRIEKIFTYHITQRQPSPCMTPAPINGERLFPAAMSDM